MLCLAKNIKGQKIINLSHGRQETTTGTNHSKRRNVDNRSNQ